MQVMAAYKNFRYKFAQIDSVSGYYPSIIILFVLMNSLFKTLGVAAFLIWGVLHIWVLFDGFKNYLEGPKAQYDLLIGGSKVPKDVFQHSSHPPTSYTHSQLMFNFTQDVGGYGFLGVIIAYMIQFNHSP